MARHQRGDGGELHDAGDDDVRITDRRSDVVVSNIGGNVTSTAATLTVNAAAGGADDHDAAGEPDGDGGTDGDVHGGGWRDSAAELPVAEERGEHQRGDGDQLYDASNNDDG